MRTTALFSSALLLGLSFAVIACGDREAPFDPVDHGSLATSGPPNACTPWPECKDDGGGGSTQPTPVRVVVPFGFDLESDGGGAYTHEVDDVLAQIFGSDNFGLDVTARKKGRGNNQNVTDRRVCLTIRSLDGTVLPREPGEEACLDLNITTSQPDDPPGGFGALSVGESMTTAMRFLWAGPDGSDRWIRFGSTCELVNDQWVPDAETRAMVTATADGWTIESSDSGEAYWCRFGPSEVEPHPLSGDPDGRVVVTVRLETTRL